MKRAVLRVAPDLSEDHIDSAAMHAALHRLHHAAEGQIADIASTLSAQERATLAVVCYKRAHLYGIGLALAAQCSLAELTAATGSSVAGSALYAQSREVPATAPAPLVRRRSITLAVSAGSFSLAGG